MMLAGLFSVKEQQRLNISIGQTSARIVFCSDCFVLPIYIVLILTVLTCDVLFLRWCSIGPQDARGGDEVPLRRHREGDRGGLRRAH
jgi:hypothetical protein